MQTTKALQDIYRKRGAEGKPLERVYERLYNLEWWYQGYGKIYRNFGAMTPGTTAETVDGMSVQKINGIIGLLRMERYKWTPVRRTYIEKASGKLRPLGIPTWSDKLLQEVIRLLLEPYYEQRFISSSHGFRPNRSCHTALREIRKTWLGTVWFIEGDIKGCFDNIDHLVLLQIIRRDIKDGRLIQLISGLLDAGYMEDWRYFDTTSGTPQGGILSPLLANIYLHELDKFVKDTLTPQYTVGKYRKRSPDYTRVEYLLRKARDSRDLDAVKRLKREMLETTRVAPVDPNYRRLRYIRYADDFLLGFVGPKNEAEVVRQQISEFLGRNLKLTLSPEKTLITHAIDGKAKFLGYELSVAKVNDLISDYGRRSTNGKIVLRMPRAVVTKYRKLFSKKGKIIHCGGLIHETDYTIIQRYQSVLRGLYNFYCMAQDVGRRVGEVKFILETSLLKTLACKLKSKTNAIIRKYKEVTPEKRVFRVVLERPGKDPLRAEFGGFPLVRIPEGQGQGEFLHGVAWNSPANKRSEVVMRLLAGKCELCESDGPLQVHHIRALADIDRPGRRPKTSWEKIMAARKRKTLVVCEECHGTIHAGKYDGPKLEG